MHLELISDLDFEFILGNLLHTEHSLRKLRLADIDRKEKTCSRDLGRFKDKEARESLHKLTIVV